VNLPDLDESIAQVNKGVRDVWREVKADDGRWYSVRILPFLTAERKIDGALIVFVDVNDLKLSHEKEQREQKLITAILNAARDMLVIVLDRAGRVLQFNRAAQELTGYSLEEVQGKPLWDFLPVPEERAHVRIPRFVVDRSTSHCRSSGSNPSRARANSTMSSSEAGAHLGGNGIGISLGRKCINACTILHYHATLQTNPDVVETIDPCRRE
jgi:transcriptional regulator with PAS, ATPase and Fis domain